MRLCSEAMCARKARARSLCPRHYLRATRNGTLPEKKPYHREPIPSALRWDKFINRNCPNGCWERTGTKNSQGYGLFSLAAGETVFAHRHSYRTYRGPIPRGLLVCHTCDNPRCVRPDHLWVGTVSDNNADARSKGRAIPPPDQRGENHSQHKLTGSAVKEIRELWPAYTQAAIGARFGVSVQTVSKIVRRQRWASIGD